MMKGIMASDERLGPEEGPASRLATGGDSFSAVDYTVTSSYLSEVKLMSSPV